ncbi:MAG: response regulator transcription factor [Muribaculaceae bacterium]|nr:response regulator transcription factor [Muribaculaceae bacterium]
MQTLVVMRHSRRAMLKDTELRLVDTLPATIYFDSDEADIEDAMLSIIKEAKKVDKTNDSRLSQRECEVLRELAAGKTNKEIADTLCISINTVITHRKNISGKLGIHSVSGLSLYAVMNGII